MGNKLQLHSYNIYGTEFKLAPPKNSQKLIFWSNLKWVFRSIYTCAALLTACSADLGTHKVPKWANYSTLSSSHVAIIRNGSKNKPKIFKNTFFQGDFKFLSVSHIEYWYRPKHVFSYFLRENMQISSKWCKSTLYTWVWLGPGRKNQQNIVENALKNGKKTFLGQKLFFWLGVEN